MANSNPNLPPYVDFYGMTRDPFSPEVEADIYYAEPTRKQRLDVLLHLTEYGNEVMVVIGPKGSGKSALLKQFEKNRQENWKIASIDVQEGFDERKFLQQLYRQMDLAFRGATFNELLGYMEKHFRQLQENSILPVILVDNANLLPVTALKKVLEMASLINDESKPLLRVIMFGTENIKEHFKQPQLGHLANLPMRSMDLPPLNEEQTVHYILHRTLAAKFNGKDIFNESTVLKIYRDSFGWPARINEICQDLLLKSIPGKNQQSAQDFDTKARNPKQLVAAGIAFAVLAAVLAFQNHIGDWINRGSNLVASLTTGTQQAESDAPANQTTAKVEPVTAPEPTTLVEKLKNRDSAYQNASNDTSTVALVTDNPLADRQIAHQTETQITKTVIPESETTSAVTKQGAHIKINVRHGNDWILTQNPNHYTSQVVAGENLETIKSFIQRHKLKDNIALYSGIRKGKPWYGLVYGIYQDKQKAVSAVDQLPPKLKRVKPWIRTLVGIHKEIRKATSEQQKTQPTLTERLSKPRPKPAPKPQAVATSKPAAPVVEITRQEDWILRQRYNHYTLQLVADENIETIHRFINRHKLRDSIALYQTIRDDKPWHVLIYGIYSNKQLATSGISRLPANLKLVKPSIRQFSNIHKEIKKVAP